MKKISKYSIVLLAVTFFVFPLFSFAQTQTGGTNTTGTQTGGTNTGAYIDIPNPLNPASGTTLLEVLNTILRNIVMPIAAIAVVMYIIWAGLSFVTAQGKPAEIQKAQQRLLWALIGAGILLGATGIGLLVENTVRALMA